MTNEVLQCSKAGQAVKIFRTLAALYLLFSAGQAWAAVENGGVESILGLGVGARALSLGRAYTGVADDASAIYWNPAGLGALERKELTTLYIPLFSQSDYVFAAFAYPDPAIGTIGLGAVGVSTRDIPKTDAFDEDLGTISDWESQFSIAYARPVWDRLFAGVVLKVNYQTLDSHSGAGAGVDAGLFYDVQRFLPGLTVGMAATNMWSSPVTLVSSPDVQPSVLRLGAAYRRDLDPKGDHNFLATAECEKIDFSSFFPHAGLEYRFLHIAAVRAGWDADRPTVGLGLMFWDGQLDYALFFPADNHLIHAVSLGWRFGTTLTEETEQRKLAWVNKFSQDQAQLHAQKGREWMKQEDFKQAVEELEKAASWSEDSPEIASNLQVAQKAYDRQRAQQAWADGQKAYNQRQYFNAFIAWSQAADLDPKLPGIQDSLKLARQNAGKFIVTPQNAGRSKNQARDQQTRAWFQQGMSYFLDGNRKQAAAAWQKAYAQDPDFPQLREFLAKVREQAPESRGKAVDAGDKGRAEELYKQGLLKYRQHNYREAGDFWKKVLALDPEHADAKRGLERIEAILSALDRK